MAASIWKDYEVSFGNVAEADYTIEVAGVGVIYAGHAVRRPDAAQLTVRINDVCADYLLHTIPATASAVSTPEASAVTFTVKDGGGNYVDAVQFVADWSFDHDHNPAVLSDPVNGHVSAAQALIFSVLGTTAQTVVLDYGGSTQNVTVSASGGPVQVVSLPLSSYVGLEAVTAAGKTYKVVPPCHRFALVYVNAFGGWDTLLMEGRCSEADGYDRHTMRQRYDNAVRSARGTVEYANEVTRRWTLRTGWLLDGQAARMHHVIGSAHVYLYDIPAGTLTPVVITDDACEYRTYRGNGAQLVSYAVNVETAQDIVRR